MSAPQFSVLCQQVVRTGVGWRVRIGSHTGFVVEGSYGLQFHGRWASHSGYFSACGGGFGLHSDDRLANQSDAVVASVLEQVTIERYQSQCELPFVVGKEHREHGWSDITRWDFGDTPRFEVKLPRWHRGYIVRALIEAGAFFTHSVGHPTICFDTQWDLADIRHLIAPILAPETRFATERDLATLIERRTSTSKRNQLALF